MAKQKSPYLDYSLEDVRNMEDHYFVLCLGGDFVLEEDYYIFTKDEADKLYAEIMKDLINIIKDGEDKHRRYALDLIPGLRIQPVRLH